MSSKSKKVAPVAFRKCGFGRGAASNWDAFGVPIKKGSKLEDGIYQVKGGEIRRMKDTNGTGTVCVVYRVAAKDKEAVAKPVAKKAAAKVAPVKAKAPVKAVAKAPVKKAPVKVAPKAKGKK